MILKKGCRFQSNAPQQSVKKPGGVPPQPLAPPSPLSRKRGWRFSGRRVSRWHVDMRQVEYNFNDRERHSLYFASERVACEQFFAVAATIYEWHCSSCGPLRLSRDEMSTEI